MASPKDFLGQGISFPFRFSSRGGNKIGVDQTKDEQHVIESIKQILGTRIGERVFRRAFGSRIHDLVFDPLDDITAALAIRALVEDILRWEPRVEINQGDVEIGVNTNTGTLTISLVIKFRVTNRLGNLVLPFFLNEEGAIAGLSEFTENISGV